MDWLFLLIVLGGIMDAENPTVSIVEAEDFRVIVEEAPQWSDLFHSDQRFDVSKFQMVVFSFLVGIALLIQSLNEGLAEFTIAGAVIGLIGGSQTLYVGRKAVAPAEITEFNSRLNVVRTKEVAFVNAALDGWAAKPRDPNDTLLDAAKKAALKEYNEYLFVAEEAALMLHDQTGVAVSHGDIEPQSPRV